MKIGKYDILLIEFPFSNLRDKKIRPALVITSIEGDNLILCQITTKKRVISKYEVPLKKDFCEGDIRFDSNIYTDMIFTLHKSLILDKIGSIKHEKTIQEIQDKIKRLFGF